MSYTVTAEKMVSGGSCIARANGKIVFVSDALPGETLEVETVSAKRGWDAAKIVKVLEPSPHRVKPPCPCASSCGGCDMLHASASFQIELRRSILEEAFKRAGVDAPEIAVVSGSPAHYRARITLTDGGLLARKSREVVQIENCLCATAEVNEWLSAHKERPRGKLRVFGDERVELPSGKKAVAVSLDGDMDDDASGGGATDRLPSAANVSESAAHNATQSAVTLRLLGKTLSFDARGFFQSNLETLEKSIGLICGGLRGKRALDIYAGSGVFSAFLADAFPYVELVERDKNALAWAEKNLRGAAHKSYAASGAAHKSCAASGAAWAKRFSKSRRFDAAVVDPPRTGMEKDLCAWLCESGVPHIRSLSCDEATHARDIARLVKAGYRLTALYLLDFYPNTSRTESLAVLEKQQTVDSRQ